MTAGLILCAHGARDPRWAAPFESVAARVRERRPDARVRLAYLEFIEPSPAQAAVSDARLSVSATVVDRCVLVAAGPAPMVACDHRAPHEVRVEAPKAERSGAADGQRVAWQGPQRRRSWPGFA